MSKDKERLLKILDDIAYISKSLTDYNRFLVYEYLTEMFGISEQELMDYSKAKGGIEVNSE